MNGAQNTHGLTVLKLYVIFMLTVNRIIVHMISIRTTFSQSCLALILPWNFGPIPFRRSCGAKDVGQNVNFERQNNLSNFL